MTKTRFLSKQQFHSRFEFAVTPHENEKVRGALQVVDDASDPYEQTPALFPVIPCAHQSEENHGDLTKDEYAGDENDKKNTLQLDPVPRRHGGRPEGGRSANPKEKEPVRNQTQENRN